MAEVLLWEEDLAEVLPTIGRDLWGSTPGWVVEGLIGLLRGEGLRAGLSKVVITEDGTVDMACPTILPIFKGNKFKHRLRIKPLPEGTKGRSKLNKYSLKLSLKIFIMRGWITTLRECSMGEHGVVVPLMVRERLVVRRDIVLLGRYQ